MSHRLLQLAIIITLCCCSVHALIFTRDDRYLLTGSVDRTIKFWDMKTGQETRTIPLK